MERGPLRLKGSGEPWGRQAGEGGERQSPAQGQQGAGGGGGGEARAGQAHPGAGGLGEDAGQTANGADPEESADNP